MSRAAAIEALRPFAALADALRHAPWAIARKDQTLLAIGDCAITTNHIRAARAALTALEGPADQATSPPAAAKAEPAPAKAKKAKPAARKRSKRP